MLKTFAFIDLETTSLSFAKITEIAVVACERSHCESNINLPRVLHKFTVCVKPPEKVHPISATISGLDNEVLMNVGSFNNDVVQSLRLFLKHLPQPVCLVAHNGFKFDFPILKKAIQSCGAAEIEGVYCLDSLPAFRNILKQDANSIITINSALNDPEEDILCLQALEKYEQSLNNLNMVEINETTPEKSQNSTLNLAPKKRIKPISQMNYNSIARKRLNFDVLPDSLESQTSSPCYQTDFEIGKLPQSYKLSDLYEYLNGFSLIDSHRAENDAIALLECVLKIKDLFFDYADDNAVLLTSL